MKKIIVSVLLALFWTNVFSQQNIFEIMDREDLSITQIESLARQHFEISGKGKGSGYKQYQRWLYERKFHLDEDGFYIKPLVEYDEFKRAINKMNHIGQNSNNGFTAVTGIWTEKGPFSWNLTSSWNPGTGRLTALAIHPLNENIIYAGSPGGGLWKTTNGGITWQPLTDYNATWMSIFSLAIDPLNQNIVYAGTGGSSNQVIKSTDAGATWAPIGFGPTGTIRKILIHPTSTNILFACASNGIFRSINSGANWTRVHTSSKEDIEFKPNDPNIMYASGNNVVRSVDNGVTWTVLGPADGITNTGRTLIAVTPANPDYVYIAQASGSIFGRMYKSTNAGASFFTTVIGDPFDGTNYFGYSANGTGKTGQATYDMAMCASPLNANEVHIAGIICWRSDDGGYTFNPTSAWSLPNNIGYNHADVHGLFFVNNNIYSISDGGIYLSNDFGDNWIDLSAGLGIRQFYRIASSPTNATVVTGGAQDNGSVAMQASGTWVDWLGADGMEGLVSPTNHLKIWGTSQNGNLYKSLDGGITKSNLPDIPNGAWVTPIAVHPTIDSIVYAGGDGVYQLADSDTVWTLISGTTITNTLDDIAVAPTNPDYIYASYASTLYVTTDGGTNWSTYFTPGSITDICVSPINPAKIWITTSNGAGKVYVSSNSGQTFTNISGSLPNIAARSIVVDSTANEVLFVGMNLGVFTSNNSNPAWAVMTDNLPLAAINELDIQHNASILRVATYGRGLWETSSAISTSCNAPTGLTATGITFSNATISWDTVSGALGYKVQYKLNSDTTWKLAAASITATSYALTGLTDTSLYDFRVQTNCIGTVSAFTDSQFTTLAAPPCFAPPALLNASGITSTDATVSWRAVSGAVDYTIEYKLNSDTAWILADDSVVITSYTFTGLADSSLYNYRVRANCTGSATAFAQSSFTTLDGPVFVTNIQPDMRSIFVFPNPVKSILNIGLTGAGKIAEIEVLDVWGVQKLKKTTITQAVFQLDVASLSSGIYLARILGEDKQMQFITFIKE